MQPTFGLRGQFRHIHHELYWGQFVLKSMMDPLGVVENQVIDKCAVEFIRMKQKIGVVIDELFL